MILVKRHQLSYDTVYITVNLRGKLYLNNVYLFLFLFLLGWLWRQTLV